MTKAKDELNIEVLPPIFRAIGPADDVVVAADKLLKWRDDAVQTAQLDILTRLEARSANFNVGELPGDGAFMRAVTVEVLQSERALIEKRMM